MRKRLFERRYAKQGSRGVDRIKRIARKLDEFNRLRIKKSSYGMNELQNFEDIVYIVIDKVTCYNWDDLSEELKKIEGDFNEMVNIIIDEINKNIDYIMFEFDMWHDNPMDFLYVKVEKGRGN